MTEHLEQCWIIMIFQTLKKKYSVFLQMLMPPRHHIFIPHPQIFPLLGRFLHTPFVQSLLIILNSKTQTFYILIQKEALFQIIHYFQHGQNNTGCQGPPNTGNLLFRSAGSNVFPRKAFLKTNIRHTPCRNPTVND